MSSSVLSAGGDRARHSHRTSPSLPADDMEAQPVFDCTRKEGSRGLAEEC